MELSETEKEQERKVANNDVIRHFERRTIAMCHSQFHRKRIFRGALYNNSQVLISFHKFPLTQ